MFSSGCFSLVLLAVHIGTVCVFTELEMSEQVSGVCFPFACFKHSVMAEVETVPGFVTSTWGFPFSSGYFIVGVER